MIGARAQDVSLSAFELALRAWANGVNPPRQWCAVSWYRFTADIRSSRMRGEDIGALDLQTARGCFLGGDCEGLGVGEGGVVFAFARVRIWVGWKHGESR